LFLKILLKVLVESKILLRGNYMGKKSNYTDQRKHDRSKIQSIVVGILNSNYSIKIGSIVNISLGGVKCIFNELRLNSTNNKIYSIDLIADNYSVLGIPCRSLWEVEEEPEVNTELTTKRLYGIQFGMLTPTQTLLLENFIEVFNHQRNKNVSSGFPITAR